MACKEKTQLVTEYETATHRFAAAITALQRNMGTSPKAEYDCLQRLVEEARVTSEQSRLALERHIAAHQC